MKENIVELIEKFDMEGRLIQRKINGVVVEISEFERQTPQVLVHLPKDDYTWIEHKRLIPKKDIKVFNY